MRLLPNSVHRCRRYPLCAYDDETPSLVEINYHPHSGWFDEGPSKGPPPYGRGLKPPEVQLFLTLFLFLLVSDVLPYDRLV